MHLLESTRELTGDYTCTYLYIPPLMNAEGGSQSSEVTGPPTAVLGEWNDGLLAENLSNKR